MKKNIVGILACSVLIICQLACSKVDMITYSEAETVAVVDARTAAKNFSIALSKAVAVHEEVREFIKAEALKRFDNDYDVFYPYVKDCQIGELGTFRDILVKELGSVDIMASIESELPLLTIYVSDVTWFDPEGFCAESWDTSCPQSAVTYIDGHGKCRELYSNGYYLGEIEDGTIPGGAVLIVKTNERVVASAPTKAGDVTYSFISDVFDGSKRQPDTRKADNRHTGKYTAGWIQGQAPGDASDIISAADLNRLNPDIIKAYEMFKNDSYALQNDYIYYGMTPDSPKGRLRNDVRSKIVRFKIEPKTFKALFDEAYDYGTESGDRNFIDVWELDDNGKGASAEPAISTIYTTLWTEGALEIKVQIFTYGDDGKPALYNTFFYDVRARDLFTIKENSIYREQWGATAFKWYITWRYTITARDDRTLLPKWYYPENTPDLPTWDLLHNSAYFMIVTEQDTGATTTKSYTTTTKKANEYTTKVSAEAKFGAVTVKGELGWTHNDEKINTDNVSVSCTNGDDEMAQLHISYGDKYIEKAAPNSSYNVYSYENDRFTFTILPYIY